MPGDLTGKRLGSHEITAKLGQGGMGEVWRATDTRLQREVALKVLPAEFTADQDRLARFEREAQLLAQLHHPNIASIFGLEESDGVRALVMELVPGPTLAERIASGPLEVGDVVAIARQIAVALEEAHEKGIVHRDLKPANVKVDEENRVKVLDFGLAKAMSAESGLGSASALAHSPTITQGATVEGVILGTAAYMAPEQAKGKAVDKRADVWAFGVVLFEMLTGRKLFDAETLPETLGAIFRQEIDLGELPAATPPRLRRLVERCLERDPKRRLRDVGEARIALEAAAAGDDGAPAAAPVVAPRRGVALPIFFAALAGVALVAALVTKQWATPAASKPPAASDVTEFSLWVEDLGGIALSRDGRRLGWLARGGEGGPTLWARSLDHREARALVSDPGLQGSFASPDGSEAIAWIGARLWRIPVDGGDRRPVCDLPELPGVPERAILDAVWLADDTLLFAMWRGGVYRVPARGGQPELFLPLDPGVDVDFHDLVPLPDGKSLVISVHLHDDAPGEEAPSGIELYRDGRRTPLAGTEELKMLPLGYADGMLVLRDALADEVSLWGLPFDAARGAVTGKPILLVPNVSAGAVSADGTLAWVAAKERPGVVARVDRSGKLLGTLGKPHPRLWRHALSPDGTRLAVVLDRNELWIHDLVRDTLSRLVREGFYLEDPQWTPDGRTIYYAVGDTSTFRRLRAEPGAVPETVLDDAYRAFLAPDGSGLVIFKGTFRVGQEGLFWAPFEADGRLGERVPLMRDPTAYGRLAPGGKLFAYGRSVESRREAFLTTFPALDQTLQLSSDGGGTPQWSADGRSVYYLSRGTLVEVAVGVDAGGRLTASPERKLFELEAAGLRSGGWTVAPDGNGFLLVQSLEADNRSEIVVARNGLARAKAASP